MSRRINFCLASDINGDNWKNVTSLDFSQYCVLMYYASLIDETSGLKLMEASITRGIYSYQNGLPCLENDESKAYYRANQLADVIRFIDEHLLPSLKNEPEETDLVVDNYGGIENFIGLYYSGATHIKYFKISEYEIEAEFTGYVVNTIETTNKVRDFFIQSFTRNEGYEILID